MAGPPRCAAHAALAAVLLVGALLALLADQAAGQTFSYSRGWKSGKRAGPPTPVGPTPTGRTSDDLLAEDMPLFRYFLEGRGEHRASFDPWRLADEPVLHLGRRPSLALGAISALGQTGDQNNEHEER